MVPAPLRFQSLEVRHQTGVKNLHFSVTLQSVLLSNERITRRLLSVRLFSILYDGQTGAGIRVHLGPTRSLLVSQSSKARLVQFDIMHTPTSKQRCISQPTSRGHSLLPPSHRQSLNDRHQQPAAATNNPPLNSISTSATTTYTSAGCTPPGYVPTSLFRDGGAYKWFTFRLR